MGSSLSVNSKYNADTSVADATYDDIDGYHLRDVDDMSSLLSQYIDSIIMDGMNKIINQMITSGHNDLISSSSSSSSSSLLSSATAASLQPLVSLSSSSNNNIINNITLKASTSNTIKDHYDYDNIIVDGINTDDDDDDDEANNHISNAMLSRSFSSLDYNNTKSSSTLINSYDSDTTCESYTIKSTISWKEAYRIWYCSYVNYPSVHPFIHVSIHPSIPSFIIFPSIYPSAHISIPASNVYIP